MTRFLSVSGPMGGSAMQGTAKRILVAVDLGE